MAFASAGGASFLLSSLAGAFSSFLASALASVFSSFLASLDSSFASFFSSLAGALVSSFLASLASPCLVSLAYSFGYSFFGASAFSSDLVCSITFPFASLGMAELYGAVASNLFISLIFGSRIFIFSSLTSRWDFGPFFSSFTSSFFSFSESAYLVSFYSAFTSSFFSSFLSYFGCSFF